MAFPLASSATKKHARDFVFIRTYSFARIGRYLHKLILLSYRFSTVRISKFWIHLCYFVTLPLAASLAMSLVKPSDPDYNPRYVDMLFMSMSAVTVSGLGTVVMESLSSGQMLVMTFLMLFGGEVFVQLLGLCFGKGDAGNNKTEECTSSRVDAVEEIELDDIDRSSNGTIDRIESGVNYATETSTDQKLECRKYMRYVVMGYTVVIHVTGTFIFFLYLSLVPSARDILKKKGINVFLYAFSTTVSSFANGGIIATNENLAIFNRHPALLLMIVVQMLAGNTLFPLFIRSVLWALSKISRAKEFGHMLQRAESVRFDGLLPARQTSYLSLTVLGFVTAQFVLLCALNWNTQVFAGLSNIQKFANGVFMSVTTRHTGENSIDPSLLSPAVLVLYILMMYFPSSTSFWPVEEDESNLEEEEEEGDGKKEKCSSLVEKLMLSQASTVVVFIILICITERKKLSRDPINFSTLNVVFEVLSGYGNVGLSIGYSCARLLRVQPDAVCQDKPYSFSGWWSDEGKLILVFIMLYGRLKKFSSGCGKVWKLY